MICVPIVGPSMCKAQDQIASAIEIADILEFRLDLIEAYELNALLDLATLPVIVTNRSKLDGGNVFDLSDISTRQLMAVICHRLQEFEGAPHADILMYILNRELTA